MFTALCVAARIFANPFSNVFQKQLTQQASHPLFIIAATHALLTPIAFALLIFTRQPELGAEFWPNMLLCAALAVASNGLLVYALRLTDLSLLGPVNAYKAVISLGLGVFLLGEVPTVFGMLGVLLILAGSYLVVDRSPSQPRRNAFLRFFAERGVQLRFAALALSATEAVFLKKALLSSSPLTTFAWWSILGLPLAAAVMLPVLRRETGRELLRFRRLGSTYLWLATTTGVMQWTTLLTFEAIPVGYSLALFQLSTLLSVFLGHRYFQEGNLRRRLLGSLVMAAGAALVVLVGRG